MAQKNAATCLGHLVKDDSNLSIVLSLSGVHALVVKTKETNDPEMCLIAAIALATLASRLKDCNEASAGAAQCFSNELVDVLLALNLAAKDEPLLVAKSILNLSTILSRSHTSEGWLEKMIEHGALVFFFLRVHACNKHRH